MPQTQTSHNSGNKYRLKELVDNLPYSDRSRVIQKLLKAWGVTSRSRYYTLANAKMDSNTAMSLEQAKATAEILGVSMAELMTKG